MPIAREAESQYDLVPEGDYILCVFAVTTELSSSMGTKGAPRFNVVFNIEGTDSKLKEILIEHEKCDWKVTAFVRGAGITEDILPIGAGYSLSKEVAQKHDWKFINPMGLRCHAHIVQETYTTASGRQITKNKVERFYPTGTERSALKPDPTFRAKPYPTPYFPEESPIPMGTPNADGAKEEDDIPF